MNLTGKILIPTKAKIWLTVFGVSVLLFAFLRLLFLLTHLSLAEGSFFPDVIFTLIERSGRRVGFLRNIISLLGLGKRVLIVESGVEDVSDKFDLVLFRAFRNLADYYKNLERITSSQGVMFAYKGKIENIRSEISTLGQDVRIDIRPVVVPFLDEERNFCVFRSSEI